VAEDDESGWHRKKRKGEERRHNFILFNRVIDINVVVDIFFVSA
jgi:hypothetical protein